jgi:hypothetical protein
MVTGLKAAAESPGMRSQRVFLPDLLQHCVKSSISVTKELAYYRAHFPGGRSKGRRDLP